jgi:uncharacterized protein
MTKFLGRETELQRLKELLLKKSSSLIVLRGRRRIGKSRLADEFAKQFTKHYIFTGLPPSQYPTADDQRTEFRRQMREYNIPHYGENDWGDLFSLVAKQCQLGPVFIVLDEITWMAHQDPNFLGKLKIVWDLHFSKNPKLILLVSGSNSAWIEKNLLSSTGFMGRSSLRILLDELPLPICNQFWGKNTNVISAYEKFKILSITGGIPRYLEEVIPTRTAEENIYRLCFTDSGVLYSEFENIFTDLFNGRGKKYQDILMCLTNEHGSLEAIAKRLGRKKGGDLSEALDDLEESGFLSKDFTWHLKDNKTSKFGQYRIRDNYTRFYLKYIEPKKDAIRKGVLKGLPTSWLTIMGLQFENLVLNNISKVIELLGIPPNEIVAAGPYLQTKTKTRDKCQIDLLIQTKYNQLYVCEIKFSKTELGTEVANEVSKKIQRLEIPKGYSCRPVLFHVNGVADKLVDTEFFSTIIDFSELLK